MLKLKRKLCTECQICMVICSWTHFGENTTKRARINVAGVWPKVPVIRVCLACQDHECVTACPHEALTWSNWVHLDKNQCDGCAVCVDACPVGAIRIEVRNGREKPRRRAVVDDALCLGCGVCHGACKPGGVTMKPRPKRVLTPETMFDRVAAMAIERGKLAEMIFDDPQKLSHRALGRVVGLLERSTVFKAAMAVRRLRSAFLRTVVAGAKRTSGELAGLFDE